jgi:hypothetical protein
MSKLFFLLMLKRLAYRAGTDFLYVMKLEYYNDPQVRSQNVPYPLLQSDTEIYVYIRPGQNMGHMFENK